MGSPDAYLVAVKGQRADSAERQLCGAQPPADVIRLLWQAERPVAFTARAVVDDPLLPVASTSWVSAIAAKPAGAAMRPSFAAF